MPFTIRPYRPLPRAMRCFIQRWPDPRHRVELLCSGWRLSSDLPMRPRKTLSLTVTLPNEQRIEVPEAVMRWSRGQEFGIETVETPKHTQARLIHYVQRFGEKFGRGST